MRHTLRVFVLTAVMASVIASSPTEANAAKAKKYPLVATKNLYGRFLIQEESYRRLWYADLVSKARYRIERESDIPWLASSVATRISTDVLKKIPINGTPGATAKKYAGQLVTDDGVTLWHVQPTRMRRVKIVSYTDLEKRKDILALSVGNASLRQIPMNTVQHTFDSAFVGPTYTRLDTYGFFGSRDMSLMPLASLTKLMSALVLEDLLTDQDRKVVVTQEVIRYPRDIVGDDQTSEVALKVGDTVAIGDLWVSMLLASSNQSVIALVRASGLSTQEFVQKMNEKAATLNLSSAVFTDPTGLDVNNISTTQDMARLAREAFLHESIARATRYRTYSFTAVSREGVSRTVDAVNRNFSLLTFEPDGSKTGYLVEAQRNVALQKGSTTIVVLHAGSMTERNTIISSLLTGSTTIQ